jgi:hypothetical protein
VKGTEELASGHDWSLADVTVLTHAGNLSKISLSFLTYVTAYAG